MKLRDSIKQVIVGEIADCDSLEELEDLAGELPGGFADALSEEIADRRQELAPSQLDLSGATSAEIVALLSKNEDMREQVGKLYADASEAEKEESAPEPASEPSTEEKPSTSEDTGSEEEAADEDASDEEETASDDGEEEPEDEQTESAPGEEGAGASDDGDDASSEEGSDDDEEEPASEEDSDEEDSDEEDSDEEDSDEEEEAPGEDAGESAEDGAGEESPLRKTLRQSAERLGVAVPEEATDEELATIVNEAALQNAGAADALPDEQADFNRGRALLNAAYGFRD